MREFKLPDVGEGISEGEIVEWRVAVDDVIAEGDVVAEVATDKVTVELPAPAGGTVRELRAEAGDVVPVGTVIMVIVTDDDAVGSLVPGKSTPEESSRPAAPPPPPDPATSVDPLAAALGRVIAAPSTRRYAAELGVPLTDVAGSGPGGRILRSDVETAANTASPAPRGATGRAPRREPIRGVRAASFDHMAHSARTAATSTTTFEVRADGLLQVMASLRAEAEEHDVRITPLILVAKCVAAVLGRHERLNATLDEEAREVVHHEDVNLGIAVATASGLMVPVLRDAGRRSVIDLATELRSLSEQARAGDLALESLRGGTFTLSSTGGIETATILSTTPVINLPQVATMYTSRIVDRPRVGEDGALEAGPVMVCSISFDHRVVDGAEATAFINDVAAVLSDPIRGLA